jgi:hypothetical protein
MFLDMLIHVAFKVLGRYKIPQATIYKYPADDCSCKTRLVVILLPPPHMPASYHNNMYHQFIPMEPTTSII